MPEACIEYGTSFPCIRELHPCLARSDVQALPFGGELCCSQDVPCFERAETGKLARRSRLDRPELPTVESWPMQFPQPAFLAFFCSRPQPTLLPTLSTSLFFEAYFFQSLVQYRSSSFSSHSHRRQSAAPCRSLATILTCLTRVTVPDKPAETGFSLTCRRGRCFGL